jgi:tripartite-type tricarboxylate transporter receptor subunit TctC
MTRLLRSALLLMAGLCLAGTALAQSYPTRPLRWVIPYAAGGGADALARVIAPALSRELGQPVVIENKPGAASSIAASDVARSAPDGYTIFSADNGTLMYNPALFKKLPYDPVKDFAPVSLLGRLPTIFVVGPASQARDLKEVVQTVKDNPGKISFASAGTGSPHAMAMELFRTQAGLDMIHVPYRGGALSLQDVMAGQVPMTMTDYAGGGAIIRSGKVRPLAVANKTRLPQLPDVPTFAELGYPDVLAEAFGALVVPAATPLPIVERLQAAAQTAVADADVHRKLIEIGYEPVGGSAEQLRTMLQRDAPRWQKLIRELNISLD